jgi:hypothetical protein
MGSAVVGMTWPQLELDAFHGIVGDVCKTFAPHTEADDANLLATFLAMFGNAIGDSTFAYADGAVHPPRLNVVMVGRTSRGRKGTGYANVRRLMEAATPSWTDRIYSGLASGEGLIAAVRDPEVEDGSSASSASSASQTDRRLFVYESEFARVLKVCTREQNTLSAVLRDAWDRGTLRVMTRKDPLVASNVHISVLAHITVEELRRLLVDTEIANGFGNRHLYFLTRRSKRLPDGGEVPQDEMNVLVKSVRAALDQQPIGKIARTPEAAELWEAIYNGLDDDADGLFGAATARAEAQMLRLSVTYALADRSTVIDVAHVKAAHAVWQFCEESARYVFGGMSGDDQLDKLLAALRFAGEAGMDGREQDRVFSGHVSASRLDQMRKELEDRRLAYTIHEETGGRPRIRTYAERVADEADEAEVQGHIIRSSAYSAVVTR